MSNYSKTTDFEAKDSLPTGDSGKIIRGAEFETEFDAISTAIATKADTAGPTFTGTLTFETISDGTIGVTAFVDEDDMSSDSATLVPTQQSVKAYVDSQVTAQDLDFQADSGGALSIDLDSETMTFTGGTGITTTGSGNDVEFAIDSTVATLTGTQTLTNKTLTSPDVNTPDIDGGTIDGTVIGGTTTAAGSFTSVNATSLDVAGTVEFDGLSGTGLVSVTDILDQDDMSSNSATALATQQSIKAYVDTTVAATNELVEDSTPQLGGTLDLNGNDITGTGNINNTGTVTTDGLTVEGSSSTTLNNVNFLNTSTAYAATANRLGLGTTNSVGANYTYIEANNDVADGRPSLNLYTGSTATKRFRVTDGGDIEFYEDSGSTAKLTWDASEEDLKFADNSKAIFGAGSDLEIYHDGSDSYIQDSGAGDLRLKSNGSGVKIEDAGNTLAFFDTANNNAKLYHNSNQKLETIGAGIDVTGTVTADGLTVDGSANVKSSGGKSTISIGDTAANTYAQLLLYGGATKYNWMAAAQYNVNNAFEITPSTATEGVTFSKPAIKIDFNRDISFFEDTGTTAKLFWDASEERLGIGTTSPARDLHIVQNDDWAQVRLEGNSSGGAEIMMGDGTTESKGRIQYVNATNYMRFDTNEAERMRIDSSGNVKIGTGSDRYNYLTASTANLQIDGGVVFEPGSGNNVEIFNYRSTDMLFGNSGAEDMRIDSSGNLLVGTTDSTPYNNSAGSTADNGIALSEAGWIAAARYQGTVAFFNRTDNDGDIAVFRKDGVTVGSIGTIASDLYIGTGDTGLGFNDGSDIIIPTDTSTGNYRDAAIDLGYDSGRFKDLYLSGGAYLGGTGSANKLDDYEEGTWTPADGSGAGLTFTNVVGNYTKVGRSVTVTGYIEVPTTSNTSAVKISGLPFQSLNSTARSAGGIGYKQSTEADTIMIDANTTTTSVYTNAGGTTKNNQLSGEVLYFGFTYFVA